MFSYRCQEALTNHLKSWQWHPRPHRQEEAVLGEQKPSLVDALLPGMQKATLRWDEEDGGGDENGRKSVH